MTATQPMRSALTKQSADDTSLAVPSDDKLRTGQQRVLDQVHTIKRSKSKQGKNGTLPSPTSQSAQTWTTHEFGSFKFNPPSTNNIFKRRNSSPSRVYSKSSNAQKSRTLSAKTTKGRHLSTSAMWDQKINASNWPSGPNGLKPSLSDPALAPAPAPAAAAAVRGRGQTFQSHRSSQTRVNRQSTYSMTDGAQVSNGQTRLIQQPFAQSQTEGKMGTFKASKAENQSVVTSAVSKTDLTLKEAVEYLSHSEESFQQCGALVIQSATFKEERTKQEVLELGGISRLVPLLRSSNPGLSQAAAGALRNLVFKHQENKLEVQHCDGIVKALQLLKETDSTETQKQITGLLWNLSSANELKPELIAAALPALTENVVVPYTCWSDSTANNNIPQDVFYSATGCLRNLSCAKQKERQAMRDCRGLIDSLMSYTQSCIADETPDDKSVENCVCILHNLTYQLETESPECFSKFLPKTDSQAGGRKSPTIGCFSPKSSKAQNEYSIDMSRGMLDDSSPSGVKWLSHPRAMQTYLSLLSSSQKDSTLEAACGALQNLTASKGLGATAMSQILVQKLGALSHVSPLLKSPSQSLQKTALSLLSNMSRTSSLQTSIAKQLLPELASSLNSVREEAVSDETIATTCNTVRSLMPADPDTSRKVIDDQLVSTLAHLSENGTLPKGSKAASLLLYSLWNEKSLQGAVKKLGLDKSFFVNDHTTAVHRSVQVVD
ncbi:plakophilin-1 [Brachionichthys hirsutus]|uniref:plakophilin-1 n=1 Tax=Brachionichthys hirsutus TaxID=412623 RepID=UPI003604D228